MMIKTSEGMRDDNIKLNSSYALIGVVVVVAFTSGTALLLILYNNISLLPSSFDIECLHRKKIIRLLVLIILLVPPI
ncbi:MAG: hypothetical protein M3156_00915 [Thermoproteota archaeon]|nr:hypothetical protein [Thermoproteota archaeon]